MAQSPPHAGLAMPPHVYARVSGFGWTLLPLAPFRMEQEPGPPRRILAGHFVAAGPRQVKLTFGNGPPQVELGVNTACWTCRRGRTSTTGASRRASSPPGGPPASPPGRPASTGGFIALCLRAGSGSALPPPRPGSDGRAGTGRSPDGSSWVELEYLHEGRPFRQTHRLVEFDADRVCVVTAQSPEAGAAEANAAAEEVADSLRPYAPQ